jgi:ferritin-like metal-binding protein YciE
MKTTTALDLLSGLLTDLYQMQLQLSLWLPDFSQKATHRGLRHIIGKHYTETRRHVDELAQFFSRYEVEAAEGPSRAINVIINEVDASLLSTDDPERRDLLLLIHFLQIEQFEITSYEIVARVAEQLGYEMESEMLADFLGERDASAGILKQLQVEMLHIAFPTDIVPDPIFSS